MYGQEHKCYLSLRQTKSVFATLHPNETWKIKLKRMVKNLIILNENDVRCKNFFRSKAALRMEQRNHASSRYWYIIHPFSILNQFMVIIYFFALMHRWLIPRVMFKKPYWFIITSIIRDCVQVLVMLAFFLTGFVDEARKIIYTNPKKTIRQYLFGYFFMDLYFLIDGNLDPALDLLANFFSNNIEYVLMIKEMLKIPLSFVSLILYAIRFSSLSHWITNFALSLGLGAISIFMITHGVIMVFILHLSTFLIFKVPYYIYYIYNSYPRDSWIYQRNLSFEEYTADTYAEGFLIIISYFIGSSHVNPIKQPCEQLLLFLCSLGGRLYTLFIIGKVLAHFGFSNIADTKYENIMMQFNSYMGSLGVPIELEARMTEKFEYMCQKKYFNQHQMRSTLTDHLKIELFLHGAKHLVAKNIFLNHLGAEELGLLFSHMRSVIYGSNEVIFGEFPTPYLYFLQSGSAIGCLGDQEVFHIEDSDIFGIQAIYPESRKKFPYYVITIEPSEVYYVNKKWILSLIKTHPDLGKLLQDILNNTLKKIDDHKKRRYKQEFEIRDCLKEGTLLEKLKKRPSIIDFQL